MKRNNGIWIVAAVLTLSVFACKSDRIELKELPEAAFSVSYVDSNNVKLVSTSKGDPFLFNWTIEGLGNMSGKEVTANIVKKGKYKVLLTVYAQGGSDTVSGYVEIFKNDKPPCSAPMEFMTDCTSRTWKLAKKAGALWVGPPDGSSTWWYIDMVGIATRTCTFNDEWTFNADGTVKFDTKGDVWGEATIGLSPDGCFPESSYSADTKAWGSGVHQFMFTGGGTDPLMLKMVGKGAYIGLQKVANGKEVSTPQMGVDYKVLSQTKTATERFTEVEVNFGAGLWRFTLSSPE